MGDDVIIMRAKLLVYKVLSSVHEIECTMYSDHKALGRGLEAMHVVQALSLNLIAVTVYTKTYPYAFH